MGLTLALGVNLWVVAVALPLGLALAGEGITGVSPLAAVLGAPLPLALLWLGVRRRSTTALLIAFPVLVALPEALASAELSARVLPAAAMFLTALSLVGYLVAVAQGLDRGERTDEPAPTTANATTRRLSQDPTPSRWRRRLRVYRGFVAVSIILPTALLAMVDLWPDFTSSLTASFGSHAARAQALCTVAVGLLWIGLLRAYVLGPLQLHLQHDRDLLATVEADRRHARRGRPRAGFYFSVALALAAMTAVVWQRAH
ncbi:MAG TPA: hypothetical protein VIA18_08635 [Polyangia bacterium]|jgi:hypothetical protein|nr:hypothetical protein [Polyangia bacterium]